MTTSTRLATAIVCIAIAALAGCDRSDPSRPAATASNDLTSQPVVPPPPGDSTPKAADAEKRSASEGTDAASRSGGSQSSVGTAASGAPPYTVNGAPEGNKAPMGGETPKK